MAPKTRGKRGTQGKRGQTGKKGVQGARGPAGPAGRTGVRGPQMRREDVLAMVEDQFTGLRKQLDIQLLRFAQLQAQLDQIHGLIKALVNDPGA